jgi:hypothetical protein
MPCLRDNLQHIALCSQPGALELASSVSRVLILQEAESRKIACRPERRAAFAAELRAIIPDALQLLTR